MYESSRIFVIGAAGCSAFNSSSGLAGTVEKIEQAEPNAKVIEDAYSVSRDDVQEAQPEILSWLKNLGY